MNSLMQKPLLNFDTPNYVNDVVIDGVVSQWYSHPVLDSVGLTFT